MLWKNYNGNYYFMNKVRVFKLPERSWENYKENADLGFYSEILDQAQPSLFVCEQHWSKSFETLIYCGKERF